MNARALIEEISSLLQSSDHSLTPRLRRLHTEYLSLASELAEQIDECKKLEQRLSRNDAARHAASFDPPLSQRAQLLDFPDRQPFCDLCASYDLPVPQIDFEYIQTLAAPLGNNEKQFAALLQEWRKIARIGSTAQRMELLRQIVHAVSDKNKDAWLRNLMETERQRYAEIEQELTPNDWQQDDKAKLEKINLELQSPLLVTQPPPRLLQRLQECLLPLQQKALADQLELQLEEMNACYAARNDTALVTSYQQWLNLISHPMAKPDAAQLRFAEDVRQYLENQRQEQEKHAQFNTLLTRLKEAMDKNEPYPAVVRLYNKLTLLDLPIPTSLKDDIERLAAEHQSNERRLNVRRMAYGTLIALVAIALVYVAIYFIQFRNSVHSSMQTMRDCLDNGRYQEALDYYDSLQTKAPKIAQDPKLLSLHAKAQDSLKRWQENLLAARQEFTALSQELETKLSGDFRLKPQIEKILARLDELRETLDDEGRQNLLNLQQLSRTRLAQMTLEREKDFHRQRAAIFNDMTQLTSDINEKSDLAAVENRLAELSQIVSDLKADSTIDSGLRDNMMNLWAEKLEIFDHTLATEKKRRQFFQDLHTVRLLPDYADALSQLQQEYPAQAPDYAQAISAMPGWQNLYRDLNNIRKALDAAAPFTQPASFLGRNFQQYATGNSARHDWQTFFSQIMQACKYYELIATDDQNQAYYFYTVAEPQQEYDKRNRKLIQYIAFDIDECIHPFDRSYTFKYMPQPDGTVLYQDLANKKHHNVSLPPFFVSLSTPQMCELYTLAQNYTTKTDLSEEELMTNLLQEIETLKNPLVKGALVLRLLSQLAQTSKLCDVDLQQLIQQLQACKLPTENWKVPDAVRKYGPEIKAFEQYIQNLDCKNILAYRTFRWHFLAAFYGRNLVPAAVAFIQPDGKIQLSSFLRLKAPEYYVFKDDQIHLIASDLNQGQLTAEKDAELLFNGQLLWTFADGMTTEAFLSSWQQKSQTAKVPLTILPAICPASLAYLLQ